jgi:site-specific DNA-methyltransferase (adenine-specific)
MWHPDMPTEYRNQIVTGDARELAKRIPDESVDLVLTDPPFGIGFDYGNEYKDDPDAYPDLVRWIVAESQRVIRPGGLCFVFVAQPQLRDTLALFPDESRIFAACKNFVQMRAIPVQYAYDPVVFWQRDGIYLRNPHGRDWHVGNTANTNNRKLGEAAFHSCPRPLDTILYMVDNFSPCDGVVCDWFMGSGTTALAARLTGRRWIGFEIDPATAELARERVANTQPPLFVPEPVQLALTEAT